MAIKVSTDIVLDVVRAANPIRTKLATAKLGGSQSAPMHEVTASFDQELVKAKKMRGIAPELPSDIVLDVITAADPSRSAAATSKLAGLSDHDFASLARPASPSVELSGLRERLSAGKSGFQTASMTASQPSKPVYREFEAAVLKSFFETMLPSTEGEFYGKGTAGNVWRSMSADYMGQEFAKIGGLGIARQLDQEKYDKPSSASSIATASQWPYFSQPSLSSVEL